MGEKASGLGVLYAKDTGIALLSSRALAKMGTVVESLRGVRFDRVGEND